MDQLQSEESQQAGSGSLQYSAIVTLVGFFSKRRPKVSGSLNTSRAEHHGSERPKGPLHRVYPPAGPAPSRRRQHYETRARIVREELRSGVGILAGTDAGAAYSVHGFSLHDELEALVTDVGMSPLDALRTATVNPATFLGRATDLGAVTTGKIADLVLLDANPLADIANTRRISAVIADGRYMPRDFLDSLLQRAASLAR